MVCERARRERFTTRFAGERSLNVRDAYLLDGHGP